MTQSTDPDSRELMEKAIEVMRESNREPRPDGKVSPLVGAVLQKPDGTVDVACRGELRNGDHAEYTLLERKNQGAKLDDSVLFTTLEPCAPGARGEKKTSCAHRIVLARIKAVWVGIEDPDPTVDRKGIKYLQEHSVDVRMFDSDLQEQIRAANMDFLDQALERAAAASDEAEPEPVVLSQFEGGSLHTSFDDFSDDALKAYREVAEIEEPVDSDASARHLGRLGLVEEAEGQWIPTGYGLLLFGENPREVMQQAGLLATIRYSNGSEETRDFDGPLVLIPKLVLDWLRDKLPNPIDRSDARRSRSKVFELIREGVVNALVHRDYDVQGAKCQLTVTPETITISSPGGPVDPITIDQLQSFEAPALSRNPVLHYVFNKMQLAEERGLGLRSMRQAAEDAELPLPRYSWEEPYIRLTLSRSDDAVTTLDPEILADLAQSEREGWEFLSRKTTTTKSEYAEAIDVSSRTAERHLAHFDDLGLVVREGQGRNTRYRVAGP